MGLQPELIYSRQGTTSNQSLIKNGVPDLYNFNYLNLPVVFKYYLKKGINLQAGPQFGHLISASGPVADPYYSSFGIQWKWRSGDLTNETTQADLSAVFGAGWEFPFGATIDARYALGLSRALKMDYGRDWGNSVIQFSIGYSLFRF